MKPKILLIDIENFPHVIKTWGMYEQNAVAVQEFGVICGFSAKWVGGNHITMVLPDYAGYKPRVYDDAKIVEHIYELLNEADIVVAHNGDEFDIKVLNARFAHHGLKPPAPFKTVDTKKVAKRVFRFGMNTLNALCQYLGLGKKLETGGYDLWENCFNGDMEAWSTMRKYNTHDVVLLEKLYLTLLPWIKNHPNTTLYTKEHGCTKCGSSKLQSRGYTRTATRSYKRYQCNDCGGWSRSTISESGTSVTA